MTTQNTKEAMNLLGSTRAQLIATGRDIAVDLCKKHGTVTSRTLRAEMQARGLLDPSISDRWFGAVFHASELFEWTGEVTHRRDGANNCHSGSVVKIWKLHVALTPEPLASLASIVPKNA